MAAEKNAVDVCNQLIETASKLGVAVLPPAARRINLVNRFLFDYENGGLSGVLYNVSPERNTSWTELSNIIQAVASFGREDVVRILEATLDIVTREGMACTVGENYSR